MQLIAGLLYLVVLVYMIMLITRLVLEWIRAYAREYRPSGLVLVLFEVVYTLTDPPVKGLRRLIPPIRLGAVALDLSLMILLLLGWVLLAILSGLALLGLPASEHRGSSDTLSGSAPRAVRPENDEKVTHGFDAR